MASAKTTTLTKTFCLFNHSVNDIHPQSSCPDAGPESLRVCVPLGVDTEHAAPRVQLQGGPQPLRLRPGVSHQAVQGPETDRA